MPQIGSRKRPAPGTSPEQSQAQDDPQLSISQMAPNQYPQWNPASQASNQTPYLAPSGDSGLPQYTLTPPQQTTSNQLARRPPGQDTTERTPVTNGGSTELWPSFADTAMQQSNEAQWPNSGDDLDQKALLAKMDAQRKRKQIPPFVQKLSSFLDESRNTELIRWSESGDSFVVIDEEEFARTLIPELFKHKNYASFVRQLNMYGFHKKVGLSDNSMRASERKNKSPSEYYNPYFKRGRPNLLWLIHKPNPLSRGGGRGPRAKQDDGNLDEDVEEIYDMDRPNNAEQIGMDASSMRQGRQPLMIGNGGNEPQNLSAVHEELQNVRKQQQMIAALLQKTRAEHEQLYGQAASFQKLHDRHESSINAILTFLATVYNRSLEGKNGQNFGGMFGSIAQDAQAQGNVVDVGDLGGQNMVNGQSQGGFRRQPLLLRAPPANFQRGSVVSPAETVNSPASQAQNRPSTMDNPENATSPAARGYFDTLSNRSSQSPKVKAEASNGQPSEADILSMIQSTNANQPYFNGSQMDFPEALSHLQTADGQTPLTPNQRNHALGLMASTAGNPSANNSNNALTSPSPPLPNLAQYQQSQERLDQLSNALKEQGNKVDQLTTQLAPLSPSGSIPGITDGQSQTNFGADNNLMLDLDQIFNSGDYFSNPETGDFNFDDPNESVPDFDFEGKNGRDVDGVAGPGEEACSFGFDGANDEGPEGEGSAVETVNSSEATSPANNNAMVEDSTEDGGGGGGGGGKTGKRRRKG